MLNGNEVEVEKVVKELNEESIKIALKLKWKRHVLC